MKTWLSAFLVVGALSAPVVLAQPPPQGPGAGQGAPPPQPDVAPAEIQRLFDAYIVMQAQQDLQLTDEQFPRFLTQIKALQQVRRRTDAERGRILQDLRRLTRP